MREAKASPSAKIGRAPSREVEDNLRAIGEIAELRLPDDKRVGLGERIAILETQDRFFREHRVDGFELHLLVLHEMVDGRVDLAGVLVDENRMSLREGAALHVLPRKSHRKTVADEGGEGQPLGQDRQSAE